MTRNQAVASSMVGLWAAVLVFAQPSTVLAAASEGSPTALRGEKTAVEALVKDGRLEERYLAKDGHDWIEVATAGGSSTMSPVSIIAADGTSLPGKVQKLSVVNGTLVEEFALGAHRVVRKLTIADDGSWVHVATRFVPSGVAALKQAADHLKFSRRSDWSFSPSVGGFDPDAQYKAPLILVQNERVAFGIVPDVATLDRQILKRCNHALDLDVPGGPLLAVGFMPAKCVRHTVFSLDTGRTWTADKPLENAYYLFVTAAAAPRRRIVRSCDFIGGGLGGTCRPSPPPSRLAPIRDTDRWRCGTIGARWCGNRNRRASGFPCRFPMARPAAPCECRCGGPALPSISGHGSTPCGLRTAWPSGQGEPAMNVCSNWHTRRSKSR